MDEPVLLSTSMSSSDVDDVCGRAWLAGATGIAEACDPERDEVSLLVACPSAVQAAVALALGGNATAVDSWTPVVKRVNVSFEGTTFDLDVPANVFGDGAHATTSACLGLVADLVDAGDRVLDVGSGAGLLSVAAALVGATVTAVDVWEPAVEATTTNVERARLGGHVTVEHRSIEPTDQADVVFANIGAATSIELAPILIAATAGPIVLSGLLEHQVGDVVEAFVGRELRTSLVVDGWATLVVT